MADDSLTVREAVRKRPGMYVGSTGPFGVECLAHEVLENSLDLVLGGRATTIEVISRNDRSIEVRDNGPGLDLADREVRRYFEEYHDNATADGHHPHIHLQGVHGLGLFIVNALCERLVVDSTYGDVRHVHEWTKGGEVHRELESAPPEASSGTGTSVRFWPDAAIFGDSTLRASHLGKRLREIDLLIPELKGVTFSHESRHADTGLLELMSERLRGNPSNIWTHHAEYQMESGVASLVDLACAGTFLGARPDLRDDEQMLLFCNFREVTDESGLHRAIRSALGSDPTMEIKGLLLVCNLRMLSPEFSGPTRGRVDDPIAMNAVTRAVTDLLAANSGAQSAVRNLIDV